MEPAPQLLQEHGQLEEQTPPPEEASDVLVQATRLTSPFSVPSGLGPERGAGLLFFFAQASGTVGRQPPAAAKPVLMT